MVNCEAAEVMERLKQSLVVPVVAMQDASGAAALAQALVEGGLRCIEAGPLWFHEKGSKRYRYSAYSIYIVYINAL